MPRCDFCVRFGLWVIRAYRLLFSQWVGGQCRFEPTCSCYTEQAMLRFGFCKGSWLGLRRIMRCQPFCQGGVDPVPLI